MSDLYPTKTRLALLADVANSQVYTDITAEAADSGEDIIWLFPDAPTVWETRHKVTARIREMERAGWVEEVGCQWALTDVGLDVLLGGKAEAVA